MTIAGYDVGRAAVGTRDEVTQKLVVNVMGDGSVRSRTAGALTKIITFKFPRLDNTQWTVLKALAASWKFSGTAITVVDDYGTSYTCRYWDDSLRGESRLGRFWSAEASFRIEV
jgi:hypothetical protein